MELIMENEARKEEIEAIEAKYEDLMNDMKLLKRTLEKDKVRPNMIKSLI